MAKSPDNGPAGSSDFTNPFEESQQDSNERRTVTRGGSPRGAAASGAASGTGSASPAEASQPQGQGRNVGERKKQFLVAPRHTDGVHTLGLAPLQFGAVEQALRNNPDIEVVDKLVSRQSVGAFGEGMGGERGVLVARMSEKKALQLYQQGMGHLLVERDQHLDLHEPAFRAPGMVTGMLPHAGETTNTTITVLGKDGAPVADAEVTLFGNLLPATGVTDANGQATIALFGEKANALRGLYVKPKSDHWSFYQRDPDVSADEPNVVGLRPLSEWPTLAGFPQKKAYGWGQKAMRLDQLPASHRGQGIRVAVIDSGAATTHQNLNQVRAGFDIIHKASNRDSWNEDQLGHGSHCTGVIAGADISSGLRGFAPDCEIHACKLFPGGQISQLIDALEYCIEQQIDVVNLSLGGAEPSEALEQQILRAKRAGIACIVAAGNSGGPVQYPASSPNVLAVGAIGKLDEFPPDSYHSQTLTQSVDANGYFPASFSCFGPQIGVCGPGVAITSSVPPDNFAAWDGTSMAAPHITGLAALVLAHHPDFQSTFRARGPERVERLFQVIKMSARAVGLGGATRTGYGLPDVLVAVGLQAPLAQPAMQQQAGAIGSFLGSPGIGQQIGGGQQFGAIGQQFGSMGQQFGSMGQQFGAPGQQVGQLAAQQFEPFAIGGVNLSGGRDPNWAAYHGFLPRGFLPRPLGSMIAYGLPPGFGNAGW